MLIRGPGAVACWRPLCPTILAITPGGLINITQAHVRSQTTFLLVTRILVGVGVGVGAEHDDVELVGLAAGSLTTALTRNAGRGSSMPQNWAATDGNDGFTRARYGNSSITTGTLRWALLGHYDHVMSTAESAPSAMFRPVTTDRAMMSGALLLAAALVGGVVGFGLPHPTAQLVMASRGPRGSRRGKRGWRLRKA